MAIGIGIGLPFRRNSVLAPAVPTGLSASFTVDTISGDLTWTDNSGGKAQYEIYSSTNGEAYTLLTTTSAGATSYSDTTCKQNASVVYKIRAKYYSLYSEYVTATAVVTPLCLKTNQSTLNTVTLTSLNISSGTVTINWGDGTTNNYTGSNTNITHSYSTTGQKNITISGDINNITIFVCSTQENIYGNITNWNLPTMLSVIRLNSTKITGNIPILPISLTVLQMQITELNGNVSNLTVPANCLTFYTYTSNLSGATPQIISHATNALNYNMSTNNLSSCNTSTFRKAMINYNISGQKVLFPTSEVDKFFKAAADWYQVNAPTADCTYNLSGTNMGIPTGGASNVDIVRLSGYYTSAGKTATIIVRTS